MTKKLVYIFLAVMIMAGAVHAQSALSARRINDITGSIVDTLVDTSYMGANFKAGTKTQITNAERSFAYDGFIGGYYIAAFDTTLGYIADLGDSAGAIITILAGQNHYVRTIRTDTVTSFPCSTTFAYGCDSITANIYMDSLWMTINVVDSAVGTADTAIVTASYWFRMIEKLKAGY